MEAVYYRRWDDFKSRFWEDLRGPGGAVDKTTYVFRGQGGADWPLEPSIVRFFPFAKGEERAKLGADLVEDFAHELVVANEPDVLSSHEKWALGQHYELPTPLLDWSASPYVAAFFAFETAMSLSFPSLGSDEYHASGESVAIFALRRTGPLLVAGKLSTAEQAWADMNVEFIDRMSARNQRIRAQLGLFTLLPPDCNTLGQAVASYCAVQTVAARDLLVKFQIPYSEVVEAMTDLLQMDITPRRIYGGLPGAARAAKLHSYLRHYRRF